MKKYAYQSLWNNLTEFLFLFFNRFLNFFHDYSHYLEIKRHSNNSLDYTFNREFFVLLLLCLFFEFDLDEPIELIYLIGFGLKALK